jgi:hypothetical protein
MWRLVTVAAIATIRIAIIYLAEAFGDGRKDGVVIFNLHLFGGFVDGNCVIVTIAERRKLALHTCTHTHTNMYMYIYKIHMCCVYHPHMYNTCIYIYIYIYIHTYIYIYIYI